MPLSKSASTWWSSRFLRSLERLGLIPSLRAEHKQSQWPQIVSLVVGIGGVEARVLDGQEHNCRIEFAPFTDLEWEESFERLAFMDLSAAALLTTGRLPPHIEDFFLPTGRRLLPQQSQELELSCRCTHKSGVCQHLIATAYRFAERLDRDPWLLFLVRGRSAEAVKAALAERWNRDAPDTAGGSPAKPAEAEPLTRDVDLFWEGSYPVDPSWQLAIGQQFPTVRRLGTPEPKVDEKIWTELLLEIYSTLSKRAQQRLEDD